MIKKAVRLNKIGNLNESAAKVLDALADELGTGSGRVEYLRLSALTGLPRKTVKYAVEKLVSDGTVAFDDGELSVKDSIVWFDEEENA